MPETRYKEAWRLGHKEYRACLSRGEYPYLPALDELLPEQSLAQQVDLGVIQVPAEMVVGTKTAGRANIFAKNFMPLGPEPSEFSGKWETLCQSHLREGIREPVKAYEYLRRYYVEEGNKRVSVLKFFGAVTIPAHVIRVMPEKNGSPESELYYEYVDFYSLSRIIEVEFSRPGSYVRLQALLGKAQGEAWTDEDRSDFRSAYYMFRRVYRELGGGKLETTAGDAMLSYLEIYGWAAMGEKSDADIRRELSGMWEEIALRQEPEPIDVKLDPEEKKPGLLSKMLLGGEPHTLRVAFVHDADPESSSWTRGQERGREYVQRVFGDQLDTVPYFGALDADPEETVRRAISEGSTVIFTTSPRLLPASLKAAVERPDVTIFNCSLNQSHRYIRTYYARMYEAKFIVGAVAGALAGNGSIGYLGDYPIFGQIAGINAFALGAQMVNPRARVFLEWTSVGGSDEALRRLTSRGIQLISSQDLVRQGDEWRAMGLNWIRGGETVNLACPLWQWGTYYEELLRRVKDRSVQAEYVESGRAVNYYWGMSAGVVDVRLEDTLPSSVKKMALLLKKAMCAGLCNPFRGPLYTQNGRVLENDEKLTPDQIIGMDYLMENVVGSIPPYEALSDLAKATVRLVGVTPFQR